MPSKCSADALLQPERSSQTEPKSSLVSRRRSNVTRRLLTSNTNSTNRVPVKFCFCWVRHRGMMRAEACWLFINLIGNSAISLTMCHSSKQRKSGQNTSNLASWRGASADAPWSVGLHSTEYLPFLHVVFGDFPAENVPKNAKNRPIL